MNKQKAEEVIFDRDYKKASKKFSKVKYKKIEILEKLKDYTLIDKHRTDLPMGKWYRYFTKQYSKRPMFRSGGRLIKNTKLYIVLVNRSKNFSWSVAKKFITKLYFNAETPKTYKLKTRDNKKFKIKKKFKLVKK